MLGLGRVDSSLPGGLCLVVVSSECFPSIRSQGGDGVLSFDGLLHATAPSKGKPVTTRSLTSFHGLLDGIENLVPTNRLSGAACGLFSGLGIVFLCRLLRPPLYLRTSGIDQAWIGPIQCIGVILEIITFPFEKLSEALGVRPPCSWGAFVSLPGTWSTMFPTTRGCCR